MSDRVHVFWRESKQSWYLYHDDPITERRRTRSARTVDETEAHRAAERWQAELDAATPASNPRADWETVLAEFRVDFLNQQDPKYRAALLTPLNRFETLIQPARIGGITPATLKRFERSLQTGSAKVAKTSQASYWRHFRVFLAWCVDAGYLPRIPKLPRVRLEKRDSVMRGRPVTDEQLDRLLRAVPKVIENTGHADAWCRYLRALHLSGLRRDESIQLSWDQTDPFCVDLSDGDPCLRIYAASHKSRRDQLLPLTPDFAELLLATHPADRTGPVFQLHGRTGRRIRTGDGAARVLSAIAERGKVQITHHDFRRAFATRWAPRVQPAILQQLLRHRDIHTTMKYYVRLDAQSLNQQIRAVELPNQLPHCQNPSDPSPQKKPQRQKA